MASADAVSAASPFKKSVAREYLESIAVAVILALFIRTYVVQAFKIPTGSMETNLLIGDHLLVNKEIYSPSGLPLESALLPKKPIQRGHVIVFKFPEDPTRDFIKRVIGLPGETLELKGKTVYIDGKPLQEPYVRFLFADDIPSGVGLAGTDPRRKFGPVTVPVDMFFMMGDNRDNSED